jgi:hypothetical protein
MEIAGIDSALGKRIAVRIAEDLGLMRELDKHAPNEVDTLVAALLRHIRAWRPQALISAEVSDG